TGPRTRRSSAGPLVHRIRAHGHDDAACDLVVPRLLLVVPEHPEVAEEQRYRREDPREVAKDSTARADRPADAEVVDANPERALADRLAGRASLEPAVVADADCEAEQAA